LVWIQAVDDLAEAEVRLKGGFPSDLAVELAVLKVQQNLLSKPVGMHRSDEFVEEEVIPVPKSVPRVKAEAHVTSQESAQTSTAVRAPQPMEHSREFQDVLDIVKRDRPSTYALFGKAKGIVGTDGVLTVWFEFPAHREIISQANNREVVDRAIKSVYGPDMAYQFVVGRPDLEPAQTSVVTPDVTEEIREWFGEDVKLVGFDTTEKG